MISSNKSTPRGTQPPFKEPFAEKPIFPVVTGTSSPTRTFYERVFGFFTPFMREPRLCFVLLIVVFFAFWLDDEVLSFEWHDAKASFANEVRQKGMVC